MNFEAAAKEAFQILRSYDYEVMLYNDDGEQVFEPEEARRMFAKPDNMLLSVVDDGEDSCVRLYLSQSTDINSVRGLCTALRVMATKYSLVFNVKETGRDLSPREFTTKASVTETKEKQMKILEGMYGTSRSSYLKLENARMIVRHADRINENLLGARGRNIDSIYIENAVGERYLFPTKQLAPARAMVHHVSNGGAWADSVGQQIARMAQDFANLGVTARHIYHNGNDLAESAHEIRDRLRESIRDMRRTFECVCRKTRYAETARQLEERAQTLIEGAEKDYSGKIAELAGLLNTESVALAEQVLRSVAETLEETDKRYRMGGPENNLDLVKIKLGDSTSDLRVSRAAWDALKKGQMELLAKPEFGNLPKFTSRASQVAFLLRGVAEKTKDDSMANLLGHIADEIVLTKDKAYYNRLRMVADRALHCAGIRFAAPQSEGVPRTSSVREYAQWLDSFSTDRLIEGEIECELDEKEMDRDMSRAGRIGKPGSSPHPTKPHLDRPGQLRRFGHVDALSDDEYERGDNGSHPRPGHIGKPGLGEDLDDDMDVMDGDLSDTEAEDDLELSSEDILLPVDGAQNLIDDVSKKSVTDPETGEEVPPDQQYLARLQGLAGLRR